MSKRASAHIFRLLGDPIRRIIFERLGRHGPMSAGDLARGLPVGRTNVVQHLKALEQMRLVDARNSGKQRLYRVDPSGLVPLRQWLAQLDSQLKRGDPT